MVLNQTQKKKKKRAQIGNIKSGKRGVTTDSRGGPRILRAYEEQQWANKVDSLEEMDTFLEMYYLPALNQGETENINRPITTYLFMAMVCSS